MALPVPPANLKNNNFAGYCLALWNYLVLLALALARWSPPPCRAVITSLGTFDGTGTGTLTGRFAGAFLADDVVVEQGDRVFLPVTIALASGGTPADSGPYIVQQLGGPSNRYVLVRPSEWTQGSVMGSSTTFRISEGTLWAGNEWRAFPKTPAITVGTDDPAFWPRTFTHVVKEQTVHASCWIRDVNRVSVLALPRLGAPHAFCLGVLAEGAGTGRVSVTGVGNPADTYAVMSVNF